MTEAFIENKNKIFREFSTFPVINIKSITIKSIDENWVNKFYNSSIIIKIIGVLKDKTHFKVYEDFLLFSTYLTSNTTEPILEIKNNYRPKNSLNQNNEFISYQSTFELHNVTWLNGEHIIINYIDSEYIKKRVDDWEKRVRGFISEIISWEIANIEIKFSRNQFMHEGLMKQFEIPMREIPTAGVFKDGILKIAIKPFGLWVLGANGRIDLLTGNGNFVLIDHADTFKIPEWKIYKENNRDKYEIFNKETFMKLVN